MFISITDKTCEVQKQKDLAEILHSDWTHLFLLFA